MNRLLRILAAAPVNWRFFVKHKLFAALKDNVAVERGEVDELIAAYADLCRRFTDLPPLDIGDNGAASRARKSS